jgi:cytidylate kinase
MSTGPTSDIPVIAIDGTAASGKGTMAKRLAAYLDYAYLDTGLLYRRVALTLLAQNIPADNVEAAVHAARTLDANKLDDPALRGAAAGRDASVVAAIPEVRLALTEFQRQFPEKSGKKGAILDGRDIGTVIFPEARIKFYVDADIEIRAERRFKELTGQGLEITYEKVLEDMKIRDARDGNRAFRPMVAAPDAVHIDTTALGPDAVFQKALSHIQGL